ncbi:unnamed protein product, partial [Ectocarpus sp. 13 AM-2016]
MIMKKRPQRSQRSRRDGNRALSEAERPAGGRGGGGEPYKAYGTGGGPSNVKINGALSAPDRIFQLEFSSGLPVYSCGHNQNASSKHQGDDTCESKITCFP